MSVVKGLYQSIKFLLLSFKSYQFFAVQMQSKIDSLQAELRQAQANHNHSFADAERLTEVGTH